MHEVTNYVYIAGLSVAAMAGIGVGVPLVIVLVVVLVLLIIPVALLIWRKRKYQYIVSYWHTLFHTMCTFILNLNHVVHSSKIK